MESLLYFFMLFIFIGVVIRQIKIDGINSFVIFISMTCFAYLMIPVFIFLVGDAYQYKYPILANIYRSSMAERIVALIYITLFLISFVIGYNLLKTKQTKNNINKYNSAYIKMITPKIYLKAKKYYFILFSIGVIGFIYMLYEFNGLGNFIKFSGSGRGEGIYEFSSGSAVAYSMIISRAMLGSTFAIILMYRLNTKKRLIIVVFISIIVSMLLLVFNAGKLQAIIYFIPLGLVLVDKFGGGKKQISIYIGISLLMILIMPKLDNLFYYLTYGKSLSSFKTEWSILDNIVGLLNSFTYPYSNLLLSQSMNSEFGIRFGADYILPFINIIPSRILSFLGLKEMETLYSLTTSYYHTFVPGISLYTGIPNDIITVAIRQFSYAGVILIGAIFGVLLKRLDIYIRKLNMLGSEYKHLVYTNCMVVIAFLFIEPNSAIMAYYHIIPSIFLSKYIIKLISNYNKENIIIS